MEPPYLLLVDIDGLRPDLFQKAVREEAAPNLARLLGGPRMERGLLHPVLAPAPSITFTSQACLFTGAHPAQHGVPGNQFFDRFGRLSQGTPRHYAFDVGDSLSADDAVRVFTDGLAARCLQAPTLYEQLGRDGLRSVVVGHMYARGATEWVRPSLLNLARFTKGGNLFRLSAEDYDRHTLEKALDALSRDGLPQIFTIYFMGVDHESHRQGPQAQFEYLTEVLNGLVGELLEGIQDASGLLSPGEERLMCAIFSDHGQTGVQRDDRHSLRLAFPFERELGPLFDALGLDVQDKPGEDPASDAVMASNGGLAYAYLRRRGGRWIDPPDFDRDVLPVGVAFWEAHQTGRYTADLQGALSGVLVRDVDSQGWQAGYQALLPDGSRQPLADWFAAQPPGLYADPVRRLENLASPMTGDLLVISNSAQGFYFASPLSGVHGGLNPAESNATLAFGWPGTSQTTWENARDAIERSIAMRCQAEGGRQPSTADLLVGLRAVRG